MDVMNCAQIVYAETRDWLPDPSDATGVASARRALARSVRASGDGRGFQPGQVPADLADLIWIDSVKAAQEAEAAPEAPSAIWAAETDPAADARTAEADPWLKTAGTPKESGPFLVPGATAPRKLFVYREVEPNLAGRYPRTASDVPMPVPAPAPVPVPVPAPPPPGRPFGPLPLALFLFCIIALLGIAYWSYAAGVSLTQAMRDRDAFWTTYPVGDLTTKLTQEATKSGIDARVANAAVPAAVQANRPKPGWSAAKATELKDKLRESIKEKVGSHPLFKHKGDERIEVLEQLGLDLEHYLTERPGLRRDSMNLVKRWAAAIATILVMLGVLGWRSKRTLAGVLIGSRNRLSLSRLQLYIWTTLVLSMFLVTAAFLIGVAPRAALLPAYPAEIWALLGIVIATPVASGLILKPKQEQQPSATALTESGVEDHRGVLEARSSSDRWSFLDLFTGEEVANAGEVDVSRFQSFIITVILVTIFVGWCAQIFWNIEPQAALQWAKWAKSGCYPPLDTTFVGLLAVSHGSYLAFKAVTKTETSG